MNRGVDEGIYGWKKDAQVFLEERLSGALQSLRDGSHLNKSNAEIK